ncbi:hypothetical protein [Streptomyces sp. NPDC046332]|uniref:hypothetical protein n=1 Tax=Streptomyces sp. NPDC046332 TaxID=3155133 RepID=UPI0033F5B8B2
MDGGAVPGEGGEPQLGDGGPGEAGGSCGAGGPGGAVGPGRTDRSSAGPGGAARGAVRELPWYLAARGTAEDRITTRRNSVRRSTIHGVAARPACRSATA